MIYQAILVACLVSQPTECRTHEMIIHGNGIPYSVAIEAQSLAEKWIAEHPGYVQSGLSVRPGRAV